MVSEEQEFLADLDRLDAEQPGVWDHDARIARARSFLKTLCPRSQAVEIYGEDLVLEAEKLNANEGK